MRLNKKEITFKVLRVLMALSFLSGTIGLDLIGARLAYSEPLNLPAINQFVPLSDTYSFPVLKGLRFDPANPLTLEFIVDTADQKDVSQEEASSLIKYFLAALTIPEEEIWVNLSPYEQDRVIPENLGQTDLGKGLLSQDYVLKQLTSSLTYPESDTGKDYWERTYAEVLKIAKTTNLPVSTFNKIWIVPDKAQVYENENIAVISEASLKAMLEEDYLALQNRAADIRKEKKNLDNETIEKINRAASEVMKETILPKINRDINSGNNFAALRQIYHSLILGIWFKKKFQDSLYAHYINKGMINGIDLEDKAVKDKIYNHYVEAFKSGLYNYVKTDYDPGLKKNLKRRYYSGGFSLLGDGSGGSLSWFQPEEKSPSYIASMLRIEGPAQRLVVELAGSNGGLEVVDGQGETIAFAASPIGTESEGEERSFENAVKQKREIVIVENWGMDVITVGDVKRLIGDLSSRIALSPYFRDLDPKSADFIFQVAPSLVHLKVVSDELKASGISPELVRLAAQDVSAYEKGRTGEVSAQQLKNLGVEYLIVDAHNERANDKVQLALKYSIKPIIAVGETKKQREDRAIVTQIVSEQLSNSIADVSREKIKDMVIVYQPPESIIPAQAERVQEYIRMLIFQWYGYEVASKIRILYGGGEGYKMGRVDLMPNIDGVLINDAAWMSRGFSVSRIGENFLSSKRHGKEKPGSAATSPLADGGAGAQAEKPASAASPITKEKADKEKLFINAEEKKRKNIIVADFSRIVRIGSEGNLRSFMKSILSETKKILDAERSLFGTAKDINVVIAVPLLYIKAAQNVLRNTSGIPAGLVQVAAQDISASIYSGAVSWEQLNSLGLKYVIVRQPNLSDVDNSSAYGIVEQALEHDINPIIVVGERHDQAYKTAKVVVRQIRESLGMDHALGHGLAFHSLDKIKNIIVVYQGPDYVDPDTVNSVQRDIRRLIFEEYGEDVAGEMRILHGEPSSPWGASRSYMEYRHLERPNVDGMFFDNSNVFHIPGTFRNVVRKLSNINPSGPLAAGGVEAQAEKPASAASPVSANKKDDGKTFKDAVRQERKTIFVVSSSDSDVETMEEFIKDLSRRIAEDPLLRNSAIRAEAIAAFPYSDNLQLLKEVSDRFKISEVSSELARLAVHYVPGSEKTEDTGEFSRKLKDSGVEYMIFDSRGQPANDKSLNSAVLQATGNSIKPIIVVGEKGEKDENPYATVVVANQLKAITQGVSSEAIKDTVIAYQPLGLKSFDAGQIVLTHIREIIFQLYGYDAASRIRILYGNEISGVVNRKSDTDGMFLTEPSWKHGLYSADQIREFLRRRSEGRSSSPLAEGAAAAQQTKELPVSAASPIMTGATAGGGQFRKAGKISRTPIIATRLLGNKITVEDSVQFINTMLNQRISGGKLSLKEISPENLELVVLAELSLAHLQAMSNALETLGISSRLVSLAAQDIPKYGIQHLKNLKHFGVRYVAINASKEMPSRRVGDVLRIGMEPIIVVGETYSDRFNKTALSAVGRQVRNSLLGISKDSLQYVVIAYQPPVSISPDKAAEMQLSIRELIRMKFGNKIAASIRILFSGDVSVTDPAFKRFLKADGLLTDNRITPEGDMHSIDMAEKFLEDRKGGSSSPLAAGGAEAQAEKPASSAASPIREQEARDLNEWVYNEINGVPFPIPEIIRRIEAENREHLIAGTWDMEVKSIKDAEKLIKDILLEIGKSPFFKELNPESADIIIPVVALSFVHLEAVSRVLKDAENSGSIPAGLVRLAAQDVSAYEKGSLGEISAQQLEDLGVRYVIVRPREGGYGSVDSKVKLALKHGIKPIVVVGETTEEYEKGLGYQVVRNQIMKSTMYLYHSEIEDVVFSYKPEFIVGNFPVWSGNRMDTSQEARVDRMQRFIRAIILQNSYNYDAARKVRVLDGTFMGGPMPNFFTQYNVDGVLIDGASPRALTEFPIRTAENFLRKRAKDREGSSSPLAAGGVEAQESNIATQPWRKGGIDMQGIDVGADTGSSAPLFDSGFDLRNFSGFTFKIVVINEIDDFDSLVSQPRKQEKKLTSIGSPSA